MRSLRTVCLVLCVLAGACKRTVEPVIPKLTNQNIVPVEGDLGVAVQFNITSVMFKNEYGPSLKQHPPDELLRKGGLERRLKPGHFFCGDAVRVVATTGELVFGRILILATDKKGTGPAGRGEYFLHVPDERILATTGGRMTLAYESYLTTKGDERYAWIVWMSEQPIACDDEAPANSSKARTTVDDGAEAAQAKLQARVDELAVEMNAEAEKCAASRQCDGFFDVVEQLLQLFTPDIRPELATRLWPAPVTAAAAALYRTGCTAARPLYCAAVESVQVLPPVPIIGLTVSETAPGSGDFVVTELVADGPAAAAGVKVGDQLLSIDGSALLQAEQLPNAVRAAAAGTTFSIQVLRKEKKLVFEIASIPTSP